MKRLFVFILTLSVLSASVFTTDTFAKNIIPTDDRYPGFSIGVYYRLPESSIMWWKNTQGYIGPIKGNEDDMRNVSGGIYGPDLPEDTYIMDMRVSFRIENNNLPPYGAVKGYIIAYPVLEVTFPNEQTYYYCFAIVRNSPDSRTGYLKLLGLYQYEEDCTIKVANYALNRSPDEVMMSYFYIPKNETKIINLDFIFKVPGRIIRTYEYWVDYWRGTGNIPRWKVLYLIGQEWGGMYYHDGIEDLPDMTYAEYLHSISYPYPFTNPLPHLPKNKPGRDDTIAPVIPGHQTDRR